MTELIAELALQVKGKLLRDQPLASYTSWRVGGPAPIVYIPADAEDLANFLKIVPRHIPLTWLGLGSNTLIRDEGIDGIAIITLGALNKISRLENNIIRAEAGVACGQLARYCARLGLSGLEFLAGIPGTIGGALKMNAGCYGSETWEYVKQVDTINRRGQARLRDKATFSVSYRHVEGLHDEWFIAGCFELTLGDKQQSLMEIKNLLDKRNMAQPTSWPNGGSVFRNPPGKYAAQLIEAAGLKGMAIGRARVSEKHANFIINEGEATALDIERLIHLIIKTVEEKVGVRLVPEVCIIGKPT